MDTNGLITGQDGKKRCWWCGTEPEYVRYHDEEWGRPQYDDRLLFEKICLEGFQAGLSWWTILRKRENFRKAFAHFDFEKVARFTEKEVARLLLDAGIVRHRKKIESTINNARRACEMVEKKGSLAEFFWSFQPEPATRPKVLDYATAIPLTQSPASRALSKALKQDGWSFVGPTTAYAFMQSMGMVNDHLEGCAFRQGEG